MKKALAGAVLGFLAVWLGAQVSSPRRMPAELLPAHALLVLEAKNLSTLVADWNSSPEKKAWLEGASYQSFLRSKLALKLEDLRKAYSSGAGVTADARLLENIAGAESAVAIYDIGKLEALYITRLPAARLADNLLTRAKARFATRNAGGQTYYVKTLPEGTAAFAIAGEWLIAGTREDLVAGALQLLAAPSRGSVNQERWYSEALSKLAPAPAPDLRLAVHLARVARTPYFRSYWIQRNITNLSRFTASVSDLNLGQPDWSEKRVLLRTEPIAAADESPVAQLARYIPPDVGMFQVWTKPAARTAELVQSVVSPGSEGLPATFPAEERAPALIDSWNAGREDDLEVRVDAEEPASTGTQLAALTPLTKLVHGAPSCDAAAVIRQSRILPDGVFAAVDSAVVLLGSADWDPEQVRRAAEASTAFGALAPVSFWLDGRVLAVSNSASLLDRVKSRRGTALSAAYAAGYRHSAESPAFSRMMRLLDFPELGEGPRAPMLYSENLAGLASGPLARLDSVRMEVNDDGAVVRQALVYRRR